MGDVLSAPIPEVSTLSCDSQAVTDVGVYVDATASMIGYLNDGRYLELVTNQLENAASARADVRFYGVSTAISGGVEQILSQMEAVDRSFYASGDTDLVVAIDSSTSSGVALLVTDLFQSDSDINEVASALLDRVYQDSLALGIAASDYAFDGMIYDIGLENQSKRYSGPRPLYLLMLGDHCAVADYYSKLRMAVSSNMRHALMSPFVVSEPVTMGTVTQITNLREMTPEGGGHRKTFDIPDADNSASFTAPFEIAYGPYMPAPTTVGLEVSCQSKAGAACTPQEADMINASVNIENGLLSVELDPSVVSPGTYLYNLVVRGGFNEPAWVDESSISYTQIANQGFDGSKTQNLKTFISRLRQNMFEEFDPIIGKLQFVITK